MSSPRIFFGVSTWPIGCDTPSPFSERFPLGEHAKWRCDTPPPLKRGISAILARYPMKTRQMGAIPPSAILSRKGIARYGGVILSRTGPLSQGQSGQKLHFCAVRKCCCWSEDRYLQLMAKPAERPACHEIPW